MHVDARINEKTNFGNGLHTYYADTPCVLDHLLIFIYKIYFFISMHVCIMYIANVYSNLTL